MWRLPKPQRAELTRELLADEGRRPAIVYAPSRKEAESLAAELSPLFPTAAYHAGLDGQHRDRVQQAFSSGELQVVVATIAFGMGIDKADVRTVIHTAMPATLESFYQEIGRAGRDGKPSRTVLMYSWADRRLLEFFLERDYPSAETLRDIVRRVPAQGLHKDELRESLRMDAETFERALEKLAVHGGVNVDYNDHVSAGDRLWVDAYAAQISRRQAQIEQVMQYAGASQCRMAALVRHFGDREDGRRPCGKCDFCSPERCIAQRFRAPSDIEQQAMGAALKGLRNGQSISTGQLHKQLFPREQMGRNDFESLLAVLAAAGLVSIEEAVFEKDGRSINYRKVSLTSDAEDLDERVLGGLMVKDGFGTSVVKSAPKKRSGGVKSASGTEDAAEDMAELTGRAGELWEKLRAWRLEEAKKLGVKAFHILGNKTLRAVAIEEPRTLDELLAVSGIGPSKAEKFGEAICRVCSE